MNIEDMCDVMSLAIEVIVITHTTIGHTKVDFHRHVEIDLCILMRHNPFDLSALSSIYHDAFRPTK